MPAFQRIEGAPYQYDYNDIFRSVAAGRIDKLKTYRELSKKDLFFLLYFGLGRVDINKKFIVERIRDVQTGPRTNTLDLWARESYKDCSCETPVITKKG